MHLDDDGIQRFIHGEIAEENQVRIREHLASCLSCTRMLEEAAREEEGILELLKELDHPVPPVPLPEIASHASLRRGGWIRWAAVLIGILGLSTAAYAAPGSPFPGWVRQLLEMWATAPPPPIPVAPEPAPATAGISVPPGSSLSLTFTSEDWAGSLVISVEEVSEVVVEAVGIGASFTADAGLLRVEPEGTAGQFRIRIPLFAPRVEVLLGAEIVFEKSGDVIRTDATSDDPGRYRIELPRAAPGD